MAAVSLHDAALMGDAEAVKEALARGESPNELQARGTHDSPSCSCLRLCAPRHAQQPRGVHLQRRTRRVLRQRGAAAAWHGGGGPNGAANGAALLRATPRCSAVIMRQAERSGGGGAKGKA